MRKAVLFSIVLSLANILHAGGATAQIQLACFDKSSLPEAGLAACDAMLKSGKYKGRNIGKLEGWRSTHLAAMGRWEEALIARNREIEIDISTGITYAMRGAIYMALHRPDQANSDFDRAKRVSPQEAKVYYEIALAWWTEGDLSKAIAEYSRAISLDPKIALYVQSRGNVYFQMRNLESALSDFETAIRLSPELSTAYIYRAEVFRAKGDFDAAIADLTKAIKIEPNIAASYAMRGLAYEGSGNYSSARADFQRAISMPATVGVKNKQRNFTYSSDWAQEFARTHLALLKDAPSQAARPAPPPSPELHAAEAPPAKRDQAPNVKLRKLALVIGNSAYLYAPKLPNPFNDAAEISKSLRSIQFQVTEAHDLDSANLKRALTEFMLQASGYDIAILYYAGHGMQIDSKNYIVPVDADFSKPEVALRDIPDLDFILTGLNDKIRTNIIVLDACRDDPLKGMRAAADSTRSIRVRGGLSAPNGLEGGSTAGAGTLLAFATAPGQTASDGEGANSPFSAAMSRHLATPGLEIQQLLTRVRAEVVAVTKSKQVPWSNSSLLGDVYLAGN